MHIQSLTPSISVARFQLIFVLTYPLDIQYCRKNTHLWIYCTTGLMRGTKTGTVKTQAHVSTKKQRLCINIQSLKSKICIGWGIISNIPCSNNFLMYETFEQFLDDSEQFLAKNHCFVLKIWRTLHCSLRNLNVFVLKSLKKKTTEIINKITILKTRLLILLSLS